MSAAATEKARNLLRLAELLPVPPFAVLQSGDVPPAVMLESGVRFIVRGCIAGEDLPGQSLAGQGKTIGPVTASEVVPAIHSMFEESGALECVLQDYIEGPSGVLIVTSEDTAVLEFSRRPGGVTGGQLAPFVAVFPNDIPRYAEPQRHLPLLYREFGRCDVELLNPENPVYVQVRPFAHELQFDEELLRAKMALQELEADHWVQDEFCSDLLESPGIELGLIELFCEGMADVACAVGAEVERVVPTDFLRIGSQVFRQDKDIVPRFTDGRQVVATGKWFHQEYLRLAKLMADFTASARDLMRAAIVFRTYYDLLERLPRWVSGGTRRRVLQLRQKCRERLLDVVPPKPLPAFVGLLKRLKPLIVKDGQTLVWKSFEPVSESGIVIVPGDFDEGPWVKYTPGDSSPEKPCFLVTDELYPQIYPLFPHIRGIIGAGGGMNSHLALLAREWGMPLWIQVPNTQRFIQTNNQATQIGRT